MNQTTYRSRISPYQPKTLHPIERLKEKAYDTKDSNHPVRDEIDRCLGSHALTAVVEEDMQTLTAMRHVDGLISFLCTLTKDGRVISQGRGSAVLSSTNRFIGRTVACAFNSALADAAIRATKVLDLLREKTEVEVEEAYAAREDEPATDKQREYLRQLIRVNVHDESERDGWESRISELTKAEASEAIAQFKS